MKCSSRRLVELERRLDVEEFSAEVWQELTKLYRRTRQVPDLSFDNLKVIREFLHKWIQEDENVPAKAYAVLWAAEKVAVEDLHEELSPGLAQTLVRMPSEFCPKIRVAQEARLRGRASQTMYQVDGISYENRGEAQLRALMTGSTVTTVLASSMFNFGLTFAHIRFEEWNAKPTLVTRSPGPQALRKYTYVSLRTLHDELLSWPYVPDFYAPGDRHLFLTSERPNKGMFAEEYPQASREVRELLVPKPLLKFQSVLLNWLLAHHGHPTFED